jgi:hypothetical protein
VELDDIVDPGDYLAKVFGLPHMNAGRYIKVPLTVMFDGEKIGVLNEFFDIKQPRKLIRFLEAIGQPCSETERFKVSTMRWRNAECHISCVLKVWQDANGERQQRNIIIKFSPYVEST